MLLPARTLHPISKRQRTRRQKPTRGPGRPEEARRALPRVTGVVLGKGSPTTRVDQAGSGEIRRDQARVRPGLFPVPCRFSSWERGREGDRVERAEDKKKGRAPGPP